MQVFQRIDPLIKELICVSMQLFEHVVAVAWEVGAGLYECAVVSAYG